MPTPALNDIQIFAEVARRGSFVRAAEALDMPTSTVSRRVAQLEATLDTPLMLRSTRQLRLTVQGKLYFERCVPALEALEQARLTVMELQQEPQGPLRISASVPIGLHLLRPWLARFQRRYPKIQLELHLDNRYVDLMSEGFDLVLRGGPLEDSRLKARHLLQLDYVLAASGDYLLRRGIPQTPEELSSHDCIGVASHPGQLSWTMVAQTGETCQQAINGPFRTNSVEAAIAAAVESQGFVYLPVLFMEKEFAQGLLQPVLQDWGCFARNLYGVYAPHPQLSLPLQTLLTELVEGFQQRLFRRI